ncbi:hypothetical protein Ddc_23788 [Ditylenchus destructor]|nr:hypothetical protein Ddc_23788 [Ditylenchus destructor]
MLQITIQIASPKATSSSQLMGLPSAVKAGASAMAIAASIDVITEWKRAGNGPIRAPSSTACGTRRISATQRDEDLVRLDHAQLHARLLLDHLEAFAQVEQLGLQLRVARAGLLVGLLLLAQLGAQLDATRQSALAEPELGLDGAKEGGEDDGPGLSQAASVAACA